MLRIFFNRDIKGETGEPEEHWEGGWCTQTYLNDYSFVPRL